MIISMKENFSGKVSAGLVVLVSILLRALVSIHPYSGEGKPPMFGDYEAQRHWMEITTSLPAQSWYVGSLKNDLQYWGLDYPPLTAFHMYICGIMWVAWHGFSLIPNYDGERARMINPEWVQLHTSRGFESYEHKLFMRLTVLIADGLVFIPAAVMFCCFSSKWTSEKITFLALMLFYPGLVLIDHGHFQYNCISLGLTMLAITAMKHSRHLLGAMLFTLALNYKQMELYHALPFFFYLSRCCLEQAGVARKLIKLVCIGAVVLSTFAAWFVYHSSYIWLPFIHSRESIEGLLSRLFPVGRGLYEDKVASFWCASSPVLNIRKYSSSTVLLICTVSTLVGCAASCFSLLRVSSNNSKQFHLSLFCCSLSFFLFSYQVHEKSILLPALPALILAEHYPLATSWFLVLSTASMFPLMVKDGLELAYLATGVIYFYPLSLRVSTQQPPRGLAAVVVLSLLGVALLNLAQVVVDPPQLFPHLFPYLTSAYCAAHFVGFLVYFTIEQFQRRHVTFVSQANARAEPRKKLD